MPRSLNDGKQLVGKKFGKWLVIEGGHALVMADGSNVSAVKVRCECGIEKVLRISFLKRGKTAQCRSCKNRTHGMTGTSEYRTWLAMNKRCYSPHAEDYKDYGGRGVTVCDRWNPKKGGSFANFYADLGPRPSPKHQLDKTFLDRSLVYGPETAKWVNQNENRKIRRNAVWVEWKGEKMRLVDLANSVNIPVKKLWHRIKQSGYSVEDAVAKG